VWPIALSGRLPVVALVSHYLTNKLIGRESIPDRKTFHTVDMRLRVISGISYGFPKLSQSLGQVTHVLLTRSPLITPKQAPKVTVRLACVKHAASVRPEPGSNSPLMFSTTQQAVWKLKPMKGCLADRERTTSTPTRRPAKIVVRCQSKDIHYDIDHTPPLRTERFTADPETR
jgi:hypothetical protein